MSPDLEVRWHVLTPSGGVIEICDTQEQASQVARKWANGGTGAVISKVVPVAYYAPLPENPWRLG